VAAALVAPDLQLHGFRAVTGVGDPDRQAGLLSGQDDAAWGDVLALDGGVDVTAGVGREAGVVHWRRGARARGGTPLVPGREGEPDSNGRQQEQELADHRVLPLWFRFAL